MAMQRVGGSTLFPLCNFEDVTGHNRKQTETKNAGYLQYQQPLGVTFTVQAKNRKGLTESNVTTEDGDQLLALWTRCD